MLSRLLGWARGLFSGGPRLDLYRPRERLIFSYFDGQGLVKADPMVLLRQVKRVGPDIDVSRRVAASPSKDAGQAAEDLVGFIRAAFGIKPLTEGGLTEIETVNLLDAFMAFCAGVQKKTSPSPTSPVATPVPSAPSSDEGPTSGSSSASGSTATGNPSAAPTPSPSA